MEERISDMKSDYVRVAIVDTKKPGVELVPARRLLNNEWELINSPLYALQVAAGDVIKVLNEEAGTFEIVRRGGNISVQFYLGEHEADDLQATENVVKDMASDIASLNGRMDGYTAGLIVYSIPVKAGFSSIEKILESANFRHSGSQWQYCNVYNLDTGEPLCWWES